MPRVQAPHSAQADARALADPRECAAAVESPLHSAAEAFRATEARAVRLAAHLSRFIAPVASAKLPVHALPTVCKCSTECMMQPTNSVCCLPQAPRAPIIHRAAHTHETVAALTCRHSLSSASAPVRSMHAAVDRAWLVQDPLALHRDPVAISTVGTQGRPEVGAVTCAVGSVACILLLSWTVLPHSLPHRHRSVPAGPSA